MIPLLACIALDPSLAIREVLIIVDETTVVAELIVVEGLSAYFAQPDIVILDQLLLRPEVRLLHEVDTEADLVHAFPKLFSRH